MCSKFQRADQLLQHAATTPQQRRQETQMDRLPAPDTAARRRISACFIIVSSLQPREGTDDGFVMSRAAVSGLLRTHAFLLSAA